MTDEQQIKNGDRVVTLDTVYDEIPAGHTGVIVSDADTAFPEFRPDDSELLKIVQAMTGDDTIPLALAEFEAAS